MYVWFFLNPSPISVHINVFANKCADVLDKGDF